MTTPALVPLDTLGAEIRSRLEAGDKAIGKAEDHYLAAGLRLVEARQRVEAGGGSFREFLAEHCIGKSRAYDVMAVAEGKKTFAGIRAKTAERVARHAERGREALSVSNGHTVEAVVGDAHHPQDTAVVQDAVDDLALLLVDHLPDGVCRRAVELLGRISPPAGATLAGLISRPVPKEELDYREWAKEMWTHLTKVWALFQAAPAERRAEILRNLQEQDARLVAIVSSDRPPVLNIGRPKAGVRAAPTGDDSEVQARQEYWSKIAEMSDGARQEFFAQQRPSADDDIPTFVRRSFQQ